MLAPSGCSSRRGAENLDHLHGVAADALGPSSFLTLFGDDSVMLLDVVLLIAGRASRAGRRESYRRKDDDVLVEKSSLSARLGTVAERGTALPVWLEMKQR